MIDTWIYAKPFAWDAIAPDEDDPIQEWHHIYADAATGHWLPCGGYDVHNVLGSAEQIAAIVATLRAVDPNGVSNVFAWTQGTGVDSIDPYPTVPADVLAAMRPHVTYGEDGEVVSSTPATLDRPNWGHVFFGQSERVFAGEFSDEFSEEFF